jgi:hypothetical protein
LTAAAIGDGQRLLQSNDPHEKDLQPPGDLKIACNAACITCDRHGILLVLDEEDAHRLALEASALAGTIRLESMWFAEETYSVASLAAMG